MYHNPGTTVNRSAVNRDHAGEKNIHTVLDLFCACILMCVPSGEMVLWDLTRTGKQRWTLFGTSSEGQNHNRIVFNMSSVQLQDDRELLVSTSMDREVGHLHCSDAWKSLAFHVCRI